MDAVAKYQRQLWDQSRRANFRTAISAETERAYFATPRHLFVPRYREWGARNWHDVDPGNPDEHLGSLYADRPLILAGEDDNDLLSTISQPSLVLRMLDLLDLRRGQSVFELGAGSGWNAALMGQMVGPEGRVVGVELIPDVAAAASRTIERLGVENVTIVAGDGGDGYALFAPYDRAIFTAGTYDIPRAFYDQLKETGLLLSVIKIEGGGDALFVLRKTGDHFESVDSMTCAFVQLRGRYQLQDLEPIAVDTLPAWPELQHREVSRRRFWWGGGGSEWFAWNTLGIRFFLAISEPSFRAFKSVRMATGAPEVLYFGIWDDEQKSLVVAKDDWLVAYGSRVAEERLLQKVREWVDFGMPSASSFSLRVYPRDRAFARAKNTWTIQRRQSLFVWSLDDSLPDTSSA